jgi:hypothetical protein
MTGGEDHAAGPRSDLKKSRSEIAVWTILVEKPIDLLVRQTVCDPGGHQGRAHQFAALLPMRVETHITDVATATKMSTIHSADPYPPSIDLE